MNISDNGLAFLKLHEGVRNKAYLDPVGVVTIGVGFTNGSTAFKEWWNTNKKNRFNILSTMTDAEIDDALRYLISKEYGKAVNNFLEGKEVPQNVYDAAVSAVFNLGTGALQWKWARAMKQGDYRKAAALLKVTGTTAKGRVLPGLVRRRKEEALLMSNGIYTGVYVNMEIPTPTPTPIPVPPIPQEEKTFWGRIIEIILNLFKKRG